MEYQPDFPWEDNLTHKGYDPAPMAFPDAERRTKPRPVPSRSAPDPTVKQSKRKGPARTHEDDLNAIASHPDLENKMLAAVRADEAIYLRILRFEVELRCPSFFRPR
jgi:hypothetical protein